MQVTSRYSTPPAIADQYPPGPGPGRPCRTHQEPETMKTKMQTRHAEPWPPPELSLPNLDALEALSRGEEPQPEPASPSDTRTEARCLLPLLAIERRALFNTREVNHAF